MPHLFLTLFAPGSRFPVVLPAQRIFRFAGILGFLVLIPMYFLEERIGADLPPRITHPEYFYGMVGVALAWQFAFVIISTDPARYRPLMPACMVEKFAFVLALVLLWTSGRVTDAVLPALVLDLSLGIAFVFAYLTTPVLPAPALATSAPSDARV